MKPLRILVVFTQPPLPFGGAAARWFYVLLKGLVERGHHVTAFVPCGAAEELAKSRVLFPAPTYDLRVYPHPVRSGLRAKWQTFRRPHSYMFSPDLWKDVNTECDRGFDVLHLETTWSGWLGQGRDPSRTVLNIHSLYEIDLANQQGGGWPGRIHRRLRRHAERGLLRRTPTLLALTPRLKVAIHAIAPRALIRVVPLGIDLSLYPFLPVEHRGSQPIISMIGSMTWHPSFSAADRLLTRLFPKIRARVPGARLQIVGWDARKALRAHLPQAGVDVVENVLDARPYFERTNVFLYAPERGTGMKVKVMEAFAYGVPVVTTSEGIEGLPAVDGVHVGVSDEDDGLVQRTVALLGDPEQQERQRLAARELLYEHCNPRVTLDGIEACYAEMLSRNARRAA
jgi:glycosyltransferase involved in cell wall biosynthesis